MITTSLLLSSILFSAGAANLTLPSADAAPLDQQDRLAAAEQASVAAEQASAAATSVPRSAVRVIDLSAASDTEVIEVVSGPGVGTYLQFPEPWAAPPVCGDCLFAGQKDQGQLWYLELQENNTLHIKPARAPSSQLPPDVFVTALSLSLASGKPVTVRVKIGLPEHADLRVIFRMKKESTATGVLSRERGKLEREFKERSHKEGTKLLLEALRGKTRCYDYSGAPKRDDRLVVRLTQLCRNARFIYLNFAVKNRGRTDLSLGSVTLTDLDGKESEHHTYGAPLLRFNEETTGIVAIELESRDVPDGDYAFRLEEDGGLEREIEIEGLRFGGISILGFTVP